MKFGVEILKDFKDAIASFYAEEDDVFFKNYHKCGGTPEECVSSTVESMSPNVEFFYLRNSDNDEPVGYFAKAKFDKHLVLEGFYIRKKYRVAEVIDKFWRLVRLQFEDKFYIGIHVNNLPATAHLLRNGFEKVGSIQSDGKYFNLFESKNDDLCH